MSTSVWSAYEQYYKEILLPNHNNPALLSAWGDHLRDLETQIQCHKMEDEGEAIPGTQHREGGGERWGPLRWPYNANSDPNYNNPPITYVISKRMQAIGTTWWDWQNRRTIRLGFDFDSILDHAKGARDVIIQSLHTINVPWAEVIRSTGGQGRHLYICFKEPFPVTENHTEHAAMARAFLSVLSQASGLPLDAEKDVCGGIMWVHHAKTNKENKGYELLKPATELLTAADVPPNWREHLSVTSGKRRKLLIQGWTDDGALTGGEDVDKFTEAASHIPLDEAHKAILGALERTGYTTAWAHDHHLAQTHTCALKAVHADWAAKGHPMQGAFDTLAPGTEPDKPNCFIRPKENGAFDVYRFGAGTHEHALWGKRGNWTYIAYNAPLPFSNLMQAAGGSESTTDEKSYVFSSFPELQNALEQLKCPIELPPRCKDGGRIFTLRVRDKDGRVVITVSKDKTDQPVDFNGWTKAGGRWERMFSTQVVSQDCENDSFWDQLDTKVRALKQRSLKDSKSVGGTFTGWVIHDSHGAWVSHPDTNVRNFLTSEGMDSVGTILGKLVGRAWLLTNNPFSPEFPGGRVWNRDAPQYRYQPATIPIGEVASHPWWDRYLNTLGKDLDGAVANEPWCQSWGIKCGGDYLKAWIACLLRHPKDKLPYLFFHGPTSTGKTMFAEAISLLVDRGVVDASSALTSEYNGELASCILAVVDEVNIASKAGKDGYNRIKTWTTSETFSVHAKYQQVYEASNHLHFVQMSNDIDALVISSGDTRVTAIYVGPVENPVPKSEFLGHLNDEAPNFMHTLMNWAIQPPASRYRMECLTTQSKMELMSLNESPVMSYLMMNYQQVPGAKTKLDTFISDFQSSLSDSERLSWSKQKIRSELIQNRIAVGTWTKMKYIANFTREENVEPGIPFELEGNTLIQKG